MNQDKNSFNKALITKENSSEPLITTDGTPYQITEEGSLGILAMGYVGIMLWREKKYNSSVKAESEPSQKKNSGRNC